MLRWIKELDRVIRGDATSVSALQSGEIAQPVGGLIIIGMVLGALYGLCMGSYAVFQNASSPLLQILATTIKVPVLFFLTLAITFPSLYVFNALAGSRLSLVSVLRLLIIALVTLLAVLASLGPIVAFFSASTSSYAFMLLLNVAFFTVAGVLGMRVVLIALNRLTAAIESPGDAPPAPEEAPSESSPEPQYDVSGWARPARAAPIRRPRSNVKAIFRTWILVFGLVGAQMAWVLRPFLGSPHHVFTWFRPRGSSFFEAVLYALQHLFSR